MGYKSTYRVYDENQNCLGTFGGWTPDEAIKQAKIFHGDIPNLTAKLYGTLEKNK